MAAETPQLDLAPGLRGDLEDLASVWVRPWAEAPDGTVGVVRLDPMAVRHVRLFMRQGQRWELVAGSDGPCGVGGDETCAFVRGEVWLNTRQLREGVELGVEGRRLAGVPEATSWSAEARGEVPWSGLLELSYEVRRSRWQRTEASLAQDVVELRVAPWLMIDPVQRQVDRVLVTRMKDDLGVVTNAAAMEALRRAMAPTRAMLQVVEWDNQWTADWMQPGYVSVPRRGGGGAHGMRLTMPRSYGGLDGEEDDPDDDQLPLRWLRENTPQVDSGYFVAYTTPHEGSTYDSFGNHELIPPHSVSGVDFPLGRILYGSDVAPELAAFYEAQWVQAPAVVIDTSWLEVGHVDEVFSFVPASTPRGWKVLIPSADEALALLKQWSAEGHGGRALFAGKAWEEGPSASVTVNALLADRAFVAVNRRAQRHIDRAVEQLKVQVGLQDEDFVALPALFERDGFAEAYSADPSMETLISYSPNPVNALIVDDVIVIPEPFGPLVNGEDGFRRAIRERLEGAGLGSQGQGLTVHFVDTWDDYHVLLGGVHCGTNVSAPPAEQRWWRAPEQLRGRL